MQRTKLGRVLPGFGLSMGVTVGYLSLIVLIPLSAVFFKASTLGPEGFWHAAASAQVASYKAKLWCLAGGRDQRRGSG